MNKVVGLILIVITMFVMTSCVVETSDNGDLDGFWHLEQVDTLVTGGTCNLADKRIFWSFQHRLIQVSNYELFHDMRNYYMRFEQTNDSLFITSVFRYHSYLQYESDVQVTEMVDSLRSCGINDLNEHFEKEVLKSGKLQLKGKTLRLKFKKF